MPLFDRKDEFKAIDAELRPTSRFLRIRVNRFANENYLKKSGIVGGLATPKRVGKKFKIVVLIAALACAMFSVPSASTIQTTRPDSTSSVVNPDRAIELYDLAIRAAKAQPLPPFIDYTVELLFIRKGTRESKRYHVTYRSADSRSYVEPLDASGKNQPAEVDSKPPFGLPPNTLIGLYRRKGDVASSVLEAAPVEENRADSPQTIGKVVAVSRPYDITFIGSEELNGHRVNHLKLVPKFDPGAHTLREIFLDDATALPVRSLVQSTVGIGPVRSQPMAVVDYTNIDGVAVMQHAYLDFALRVAFFSYGGGFDFRSSNVSFPVVEPEWKFDEKLLKEHAAKKTTE